MALLTCTKEAQFLVVFINKEIYRKYPIKLFYNRIAKNRMFASEREAKEWLFSLEEKVARIYSLQLLGRKSYTSKEITEKLQKMGFLQKILEKTIFFLQKRKILDDDAWIERFIEKQKEKKIGPYLIFAKLQKKGFDRKYIEKKVTKGISKEWERKMIRIFFKKNKKDIEKTRVFIQRRGFSIDMILSVQNEIKNSHF